MQISERGQVTIPSAVRPRPYRPYFDRLSRSLS